MKNLTEYKNNLICNPMSESYLFSEKECEQITNSLLEIKNLWQHRYGTVFFSVGALSYLDEGYDYIDNVNRYNSILSNKFTWAYDKIQQYFQKNIERLILRNVHMPPLQNRTFDENLDSYPCQLDLPPIDSFPGESVLCNMALSTTGLYSWEDLDNMKHVRSRAEIYRCMRYMYIYIYI